MKPNPPSSVVRRVLLAIAACFVFATASFAQTAPAATGTVAGRVLNTTNGMYLNNAQISIEGTLRSTVTNEYGDFRLTDLPAGDVRLKVFYTGLAPQTVTVRVLPGQTVQQDVLLAATGEASDVVKLDEYTVAAARPANAADIAVNEQRFSANIKNVVAADAFGDVTEGNIGEFVKYLPGVTVDYVAADVRTISVRGFADNFTSVSVDGARTASAASGSSIRTFELEQVSINNVSRVEVTKEPTPDMPADGLGGAVNLVSRNAFEQGKATFRYRAYLSFNNEDTKAFSSTPGPGTEKTYKVLPGFDFNYVLPLSKTLGIVVNGLTSNQFNEQHRSQPTWRMSGAGSSLTAPYLRQYQMQDGPKNTYRDSGSIKVDWRITPTQVLSASVQANYYHSFFGNRNLNWDVGSNNVPSPATGVALTYGPDFTAGATGRGSVSQGAAFRDKYGRLTALALTYRYTDNGWEVNSNANISVSKSWYRDLERGHFSGLNTTLVGVSRVNYDGISPERPAKLTALNASGVELSPYDLGNYRVTTLRTQPLDAKDQFKNFQLAAKRELGALKFPASIKLGYDVRRQDRDIRRYQSDITYVGPDGVANSADDGAAQYLDTIYFNEDPSWGFPSIQWADPYKLADLYRTKPAYFSLTTAQAATTEKFRIGNSQRFRETVHAPFLQLEATLFDNQLRVVTGARYERTEDVGLGALVDPRNAFNNDGSRRTEAGAVGSVQEVWITRRERGFKAEKSYGALYPSLHLTYNIRENFLARFAYARTLGRPDFGNILPSVRVNDTSAADSSDGLGSIPAMTVIATNPNLKPWQADSYDASLEYYFPKGGVVSAGGFYKEISNFFGTTSTLLTAADAAEFDLDPAYVGVLTLQRSVNIGSAKVSGAEFNYTQSLALLPWSWGRYFTLSANGTSLHLQGPNNADFNRFVPRSGNLGLTFSKKPFVVMVKWNYRGRQRNSLQSSTGTNVYEYYDSRTNLDVNFEYTFSKRFAFFANARNILNTPQVLERYATETPGYAHLYRAEEFGIQFALGVRGTF
ncbi:TonB-dependent receptor [Opitutus sp. ER46]|uniref:TonB-dependent receptor n=1 Tax=Opitutus sp. ER46 TaxID=2161864 RepID=UPI001304CFC2|nr:TonB-dependent receptor [Opitutus sp. ER46]